MRGYSLLIAVFVIDSSLALVNECNVTYSSSGAIEFVGQVDKFDLEVRTFPQQCSVSKYEIAETENGKILRIARENPGAEYVWEFACNFLNVINYSALQNLTGYPHDFEMNSKEYTNFTQYADCSEEMSRTASEIVRGSRSVLEAGLKLAKWVHNNIDYDIFYGDTIKKASWVFENRKGVCDEYSNLYVALARSLGIPARFVSGTAYTNILDDFGAHAWAEFYAGKWIPVDLTFGQYGTVDASHIATYYSGDAGFRAETITCFGQGSANFPSEPDNYASAECMPKKLFDFDAHLDRNEISDDDYALVTVEIENPYEYYIPLSVKFTRVEKVELVHGDYEDYIILAPFSKSIKNFLIYVQDLPDNYIYTMPINIDIDFAGQENLTLSVEPKKMPKSYEYYLSKISEGLMFTPQMQMSSFAVTNPNYNNSATIDVSVKNTGNDILNLSYQVIVNENVFSSELGELLLNQENEFEITFPITDVGEFEANFAISSGNISLTRNFLVVSAENPNLFINYSGPKEFADSLEFNVSTTICYSGSLLIETPSKKINLWLGNHSLMLNSGYFKPGKNSLKFFIKCTDIYGTEFTLEKEVGLDFNVSGMDAVIAWLKYAFNLLLSLFS
ncbi:MAG: hypothetical protein DRP29_08935 [Thermodesulfobacteriota bacterium]|nr:MAG: hypothetical protein DRP29_08935 [Thermodesulfobacteriota bacterium]